MAVAGVNRISVKGIADELRRCCDLGRGEQAIATPRGSKQVDGASGRPVVAAALRSVADRGEDIATGTFGRTEDRYAAESDRRGSESSVASDLVSGRLLSMLEL